MTDADRALLTAQLLEDEGERLTVYDDATGRPLKQGEILQGHATIGVGRNISGNGITTDESRYLLEHDIDRCLDDLLSFPWFLDLDGVRQRVMVNLRFNLGPGRFREFKGLFAALDEQDFARAADHLKFSLWFRQVKKRGVRLEQMMRTGRETGRGELT